MECALPCYGVMEHRSTPSLRAFYKAYSAASLTLSRKEDSTKAVAERMAKAPASTVPSTPLPNVTTPVGGLALTVDGVTIGGLGVSGAPGVNSTTIAPARQSLRSKTA